MELEFDLSDFKEAAVRRMLASALKREAGRKKPYHKRDPEIQKEIEDEEDDEDESMAELESSKGEANPLPVTEEDMSEETADNLKKKASNKKAV